jgi:hypothetical protein
LTLSTSLFHEPWWLSAVTGGRYNEVVFKQGNQLVGRLPYVAKQQGPFHVLRMPAFTHLLGAAVDAGVGKHQTKLVRRLSITRALIDQLPPFVYFKQIFDPSIDSGLAIADGLAFQDRGFKVAPQYTFQIDCRNDLKSIWDGMHFKVRQHVRRAEERYSVITLDDPDRFVQGYLENVRKSGKVNRIDFNHFPTLFSECQIRMSGEILAAVGTDGASVAMVYLVWGHGIMYYLLSTRDPEVADSGAISLLLWSAMQRAHQRGLIFDLDGVYTSGTARFLSGFGGQIKVRLIVTRAQPIYQFLQYLKMKVSHNDGNRDFT